MNSIKQVLSLCSSVVLVAGISTMSFAQDIPRTASGKVRKDVLRQRIRELIPLPR